MRKPLYFVGILILSLSACAGEGSKGTSPNEEVEIEWKGGIMVKKADAENICRVDVTPELLALLSPEQYRVLVKSATEPPFDNAYWDNHEPGIYVDAIDGTPLFSSKEKYDSGSGWPSFWEAIADDRIEYVEDLSYGMKRIEIKSKSSGGHLGHVFEDGPPPTGLRYCVNSASLRFIPAAKLAQEGYAELERLFK
jgi:methionine-R-sulfoxide reductase